MGWRRELDALKSLHGSVKVVLWRALRRTHLWVATPPERRKGLFNPPSEVMLQASGRVCMREPELIEPVGVFTALLRAPHEAESRPVVEACRRVQEWADARGMLSVAVQFAEAAATVQPESAARANEAARLCRRAAYDDRAADWYLRAYKLGVRGKGRANRKQSLWALLGYGALMKDLGQYDEAKLYYNRAARAAYSMGLRKEAAEAQHDLMGLAAEMGEFTAAEWHARQALKLYPARHTRVPYFVHDFAFVLIRNCFYTFALALLEKLLPLITRPEEEVLVYGSMARATGGIGQRKQFEVVEREILQRIQMYQDFAPSALNGLAEGARALGDWERAEQYARAALALARTRKDAVEEQVASVLLGRIAMREAFPLHQDPPDQHRLELLMRRFVIRLQTWKAPGQSKPGADPDTGSTPANRSEASVA